MKVTDFQWDSVGHGFEQPETPVIVYWKVQTAPPAGEFAVMVSAAIAEDVGPSDYRHFTCGVEVEADENKPGWREAMGELLIRTCLERWET